MKFGQFIDSYCLYEKNYLLISAKEFLFTIRPKFLGTPCINKGCIIVNFKIINTACIPRSLYLIRRCGDTKQEAIGKLPSVEFFRQDTAVKRSCQLHEYGHSITFVPDHCKSQCEPQINYQTHVSVLAATCACLRSEARVYYYYLSLILSSALSLIYPRLCSSQKFYYRLNPLAVKWRQPILTSILINFLTCLLNHYGL